MNLMKEQLVPAMLTGVKDLGVSLLRETCYNSLIEYNTDAECLKELGQVLVVGLGGLVKVPQILRILQSQSTQGLSLTSSLIETLTYTISTITLSRLSPPPSFPPSPSSSYTITQYASQPTILALQSALIVLLILYHTSITPSSPSKSSMLAAGASTFMSLITAMQSMDESTLGYLSAITVPLGIFARVPQIMKNAEAQSTGVLSSVGVGLQLVLGLVGLGTALRGTMAPSLDFDFDSVYALPKTALTLLSNISSLNLPALYNPQYIALAAQVVGVLLDIVLLAQILVYSSKSSTYPATPAVSEKARPSPASVPAPLVRGSTPPPPTLAALVLSTPTAPACTTSQNPAPAPAPPSTPLRLSKSASMSTPKSKIPRPTASTRPATPVRQGSRDGTGTGTGKGWSRRVD